MGKVVHPAGGETTSSKIGICRGTVNGGVGRGIALAAIDGQGSEGRSMRIDWELIGLIRLVRVRIGDVLVQVTQARRHA